MSSCLLEASSIRKNKISLTDYNYQKDIQNRLLLAKFSLSDLKVLEEILYSSHHSYRNIFYCRSLFVSLQNGGVSVCLVCRGGLCLEQGLLWHSVCTG